MDNINVRQNLNAGNISTINRRPDVPQLRMALDDLHFLFETYRATHDRRTAKSTQRSLRYKLDYFVQFWTENGDAHDWILTPEALIAFNEWLDHYRSQTEQALAWNTRNDALRRLRQVLRWAAKLGYVDQQSLANYIPYPNGLRKVPAPAPDLSTWRAIWRVLDQSLLPARDKAIFAMLAGTGMRCGECATLRVEDFKWLPDGSGYVTIRTSKTGGRNVAIDDLAGPVIREYTKAYGLKKAPLFFSLNEPVSSIASPSVMRILRKASENAHVRHLYSGTHDFRRAFATYWTRKLPGEGYSWLLARQLGHTVSSSMTSYYSRTDVEDIRKLMMRHKPLSLFAQMIEEGK